LCREWFDLLFQTAFSSTAGLFVEENGILKINPASSNVPKHLEYFRFLGRIHSIAIIHGFLIDTRLVPLFYPLIGKDSDPDVARLIKDAVKDSITTL
jgi:E3 ubiquitin-protein ligase NEDD4